MQRDSWASLMRIHSVLALVMVLGFGCGDGDPPADPTQEPPPVGSPTVDSFEAAPYVLEGPGTTTLSWQTTGADSIALLQDGMALEAGDGWEAAGSVEIRLEATAEFELIATNEKGSASETLRVEVEETPPPPTIASFTGPEVVGLNEGGFALATLRWDGVADADELVLEADTMAPRSLNPSMAEGSVTLELSEDTVFTLIARSEGGEAREVVEVRVVPLPSIESFAVDRSWVGLGDPVEVSWVTTGAAVVELWANGVLVEEVAPQSASGTHTLTFNFDTELELRAFNEVGGEASASEMVIVALPVVQHFTGSEEARWLGQPLVLSWRSRGGMEARVTTAGGAIEVCATDDVEAVNDWSCD